MGSAEIACSFISASHHNVRKTHTVTGSQVLLLLQGALRFFLAMFVSIGELARAIVNYLIEELTMVYKIRRTAT